MEPATVFMITRAAIAAGSSKKVRTGILAVIAALCVPFVLAVMCFMNIAAGGADHNRAAVRYAFQGGDVPLSMPRQYKEYIIRMQESFAGLDAAMDGIDAMAEGEKQDRYLVKAVFYSLYFGTDIPGADDAGYAGFADCFVEYEERKRTTTKPDGTKEEETYQVSIAITDRVHIFEKLAKHLGKSITYERQSNAMNVLHLAKYGTTAPQEGDGFSDWDGWNPAEDVSCYDLPESEIGERIVEHAKSRLGDPYSQAYRGQGSYVDCSYLALWCYGKEGIILPGTAAEQGRYLVEKKRTIRRADLKPGDLVFWSHKPNGRFMNITHVGIYAGDGMIVDASSSKGEVVYRALFDNDKQVLYGRP